MIKDEKFKLSRLRLQNYKVFDDKEIEFNDSNLIVLDGPNGFGKTSIFDALELLITGDISRISSNNNITKNETFESVFIMKDTNKDLIIKAEFVDDINTKKLVIIKRIIGIKKNKKSKNYNPTKLKSLIKTYITDDYNLENYDTLKEVEHNKIYDILDRSISQNYNLFYYIKQEDRLSFLNHNEKQRMDLINRLFSINEDKKLADRLDKSLRYCRAKNKKISEEKEEIKGKIEIIDDEENNITLNPIEYKRLLPWLKRVDYWDEVNVKFSSIDKLNDAVNVIAGIKAFLTNYSIYKKHIKNQWIINALNEIGKMVYYGIILGFEIKYDDIQLEYNKYKRLEEIRKHVKSSHYEKVDFGEISNIFNVEIDMKYIDEIKDQIRICDKNMGRLSLLSQELIRARDSFYNKSVTEMNKEGKFLKDSQCLLCGYDWGDGNELHKQINKTTISLSEFKDDNASNKESKVKKLEQIYSEYKDRINAFMVKYNFFSNIEFDYIFDKRNNVKEGFIAFKSKVEEYKINIEDFKINAEDIDVNEVKFFYKKNLHNYIEEINPEFYEKNKKYKFDKILNTYFNDNKQNLSKLSIEDVENKMKYIQYLYYDSNIKRKQELLKRKSILDRYSIELDEKLIPSLEKAKDSYLNAIGIYQNEMIKNIEIPFYLFAGRLLQNYQGGIGVFIKEENNSDDEISKLDKIKFVSPNRQDHDILYTLSSGQLSAVIIALTLALNKVYGHASLPCILIDDPVQTMDDINIASFVELLRNEFPDKQIIISTHEDTFSRYIRYKFDKYNYKTKAITLKDDIPEVIV